MSKENPKGNANANGLLQKPKLLSPKAKLQLSSYEEDINAIRTGNINGKEHGLTGQIKIVWTKTGLVIYDNKSHFEPGIEWSESRLKTYLAEYKDIERKFELTLNDVNRKMLQLEPKYYIFGVRFMLHGMLCLNHSIPVDAFKYLFGILNASDIVSMCIKPVIVEKLQSLSNDEICDFTALKIRNKTYQVINNCLSVCLVRRRIINGGMQQVNLLNKFVGSVKTLCLTTTNDNERPVASTSRGDRSSTKHEVKPEIATKRTRKAKNKDKKQNGVKTRESLLAQNEQLERMSQTEADEQKDDFAVSESEDVQPEDEIEQNVDPNHQKGETTEHLEGAQSSSDFDVSEE